MQDSQNQTFEYYKELYEKELKKNEALTEALVTAEAQRDAPHTQQDLHDVASDAAA